jgi:glycosyltransferase involved in cell wall biosynthesis
MKIIVVLPNAKFGGVEKMRLRLIKIWLENGHDIKVIFTKQEGELVEEYIKVVGTDKILNLNTTRFRLAIIRLARAFSGERADVLLIGMWPLTCISIIAWLVSGKRGKIFLSEHTHLSTSVNIESRRSIFFLKFSMSLFYPLANGLIAVSDGVKSDMMGNIKLPHKPIKVLYNPAYVKIDQDHEYNYDPSCRPTIVAVGELKFQKGFDVLIRAIALISKESRPKLVIVGEGQERKKLELLIHELSLSEFILLAGYCSNPTIHFQKAQLFVLSSRWEGFGNVLVEALSHGIPIVATDCRSGPAEILANGTYGILVPPESPTHLAQGIALSLSKTHDRKSLISRASEYSPEIIAALYIKYFREVSLAA